MWDASVLHNLYSKITIKKIKIMEGNLEGYNLTPDLYKKARMLGMKDVRYYIYASLRATGFSIRNSWMIAFQGYGCNWSKDVLEREMNKLESLESVQKRISEVEGKKAANSGENLTPEELAKATSKEEIMRNLVIAQRKQKLGSPEWQKTTAMIADYAKIKQDELQTEDTTVHYYIPLSMPRSCTECVIFKNGQADFQKKKG